MIKKVNLFVLPHAGGHSHSYQIFENFISDSIRLIPLEYPGRGTRVKEPLIGEMHALVENIFDQLKNDLQVPFAIYGHSMGALVSLLLIHKIIKSLHKYPLHLFVSGACGPTVKDKSEIYHLNSKDFWNKLAEQGGISEEILKDEELKKYLEPILRNDSKVTEFYSHKPNPKSKSIPITILAGSADSIAPVDEVLSWQKETQIPTIIYKFEGGHFFIFDEIESIAAIFNKTITEKISIPAAKLI